jgi:NDP-sugar pyrophosphorylase family protein
VEAWLERRAPAGLELAISFEPVILGTGGGLVAARPSLGEEPFLLLNADVLATAQVPALLQRLEQSGALAVLGLVDEPRVNTVAVDNGGRVLGFQGQPGLPGEARWLTYSGLAAIHPRLLDFLPAGGHSTLVQGIKAALAAGGLVLGQELDGFWDDLGTPEKLWRLHRRLANSPPPGLEHLAPAGPALLAPQARLHPQARVEGFAVLGRGAVVEAGARLRDVVLLPGARAAAGAQVSQAVLGDGFLARGRIEGGAYA